MQNTETAVAETGAWLSERQEAMVGLLRRIVDIDSGSHDKAGVDRVVTTLAEVFGDAGLTPEVIPRERNGNLLRVRIGPRQERGGVLLLGHCDTVFPAGEAARRPFTVRGTRAHGPGVADMKAGVVMNAFVLLALARQGRLAQPVTALFTGDEEIASPASQEIIRAEATGARAVFNAEPGRPGGEVVTGRRACLFLRLRITGKAAHSGVNFEQGRSALVALAHKILALQALCDPSRLISVNVGLASGGQSANTVAPSAEAALDVRYADPADRAPLMQAIGSILTAAHVEGTTTEYTVDGAFPPFASSPASDALFRHYVAGAAAEGERIVGTCTMGAADSGFAAETGAPTLCGTGPVGGHYHSPDEYIELPSLLGRARLVARAILTLPD